MHLSRYSPPNRPQAARSLRRYWGRARSRLAAPKLVAPEWLQSQGLTIPQPDATNYPPSEAPDPGRHHVGIPGDIISECPGDFIGIRIEDLPVRVDRMYKPAAAPLLERRLGDDELAWNRGAGFAAEIEHDAPNRVACVRRHEQIGVPLRAQIWPCVVAVREVCALQQKRQYTAARQRLQQLLQLRHSREIQNDRVGLLRAQQRPQRRRDMLAVRQPLGHKRQHAVLRCPTAERLRIDAG